MKYRERLYVPASWWVIGLFFAVSFVTAVGFYLGPEVALGAGIVTTIGVAAALLLYGSVTIEADESGLRAGQAWLDWEHAGPVEVHDATASRVRLGPGADRRALLVTRPYLAATVEIGIDDPADDHPYWLLSTRHPARLAEAIELACGPSREPGGTTAQP